MIAENAESLKLDGVRVGDTVVYAAHGVGQVVAREQQQVGGTERDCVVVELAAGMRVTLALDEAGERLRAVADENQLENVRRTLAADSAERDSRWTARIRDNKAKLAGGSPTDLAELVRDGSRFEVDGSRLSHVERRLYLQARELLTRELCSARGLEQEEAAAWIDAQIAAPEGSED